MTNADLAKRLREKITSYCERKMPVEALTNRLLRPADVLRWIDELDAAAAIEATPTLEQVLACVRWAVREGPVRNKLVLDITALYAQPVPPSDTSAFAADLASGLSDLEEGRFTVTPQPVGDDGEDWEVAGPFSADMRGAYSVRRKGVGVCLSRKKEDAELIAAALRRHTPGDPVAAPLWEMLAEERRKVAQLTQERDELQELLDAADVGHADEEDAHADTLRQLAAAQQRAEEVEAYKARWHALTGWILDRLAAGEIYCKGNYEAWKAGLGVVYDRIKELDPNVVADMDAAPPAAEPDVPRPPKPPMLLAKLVGFPSPLWFVRWRGCYRWQLGINSFTSDDLQEVDRDASDAAAVRLYLNDLEAK